MNYSNKVSFDRCVLHNCEVETFFFYTFIAIVFLVIGGFVLAVIFGLYMGWQAPPPVDFRDESYGQLGIPELERLSGIAGMQYFAEENNQRDDEDITLEEIGSFRRYVVQEENQEPTAEDIGRFGADARKP